MDDNELDNIKVLMCPFLYNNLYSIGLGISMYLFKKHQCLPHIESFTLSWKYIHLKGHQSSKEKVKICTNWEWRAQDMLS